MAYVDLPFVDVRVGYRRVLQISQPSLAQWVRMFHLLRHTKPTQVVETPRLGLSVNWNAPGTGCYWWEEWGVKLWLPALPSTASAAWFVVWTAGSAYHQYLGRVYWDLGGRAFNINNRWLVLSTPLWRTWRRRDPIEIWPSILCRVPTALPTWGAAGRWYNVYPKYLRVQY